MYQLVEGDHALYHEIVEAFLLSNDVQGKYQFEAELDEVKTHINMGKYDLFYQHANNPMILAQLFLDF